MVSGGSSSSTSARRAWRRAGDEALPEPRQRDGDEGEQRRTEDQDAERGVDPPALPDDGHLAGAVGEPGDGQHERRGDDEEAEDAADRPHGVAPPARSS
jgi:hypothetical protein